MLRDERDYLLRMIAAAAALAARLREKLRDGAPAAEVAGEARAAQAELLGRDASLLMMLDPRSAAQTLGDDKRLEQWIALMGVEAEALRAAGRDQDATALDTRAAALAASRRAAG